MKKRSAERASRKVSVRTLKRELRTILRDGERTVSLADLCEGLGLQPLQFLDVYPLVDRCIRELVIDGDIQVYLTDLGFVVCRKGDKTSIMKAVRAWANLSAQASDAARPSGGLVF